jgi:phosphinothricin acetyltransferase
MGTTGYLVRDAVAGLDAPRCLAIYAPFVLGSPVSFESVVPSEAEFAERIRHYGATHPWLVAEAPDGEIGGFAYGSPHRERAAYRWAADVSVYVGDSHRRRGLGSALYLELFDRLRKQGIHVACAGITLPNDASVGLHASVGFEPVGIYRRIGWKEGAWHDVSWWQLDLGLEREGPPAEPAAPSRT